MKPLVLGLALAAVIAAPALAHDRQHRRHYSVPSYADQYDRPGDYRCDAYWDRGRDDCDAAWRGPFRSSYGHGYVYRRHSSYGHGYTPGYGYGHQPSYDHGGRDWDRVRWCEARFRSYDPRTGYYRTYDGRMRWCG
ncbi:BA14K family protein [Brevundimonas sp. 2R-24]|uniref:Lectin-like protein BA14k n=1 Tax=Peiella sedimenti TaxID=3061083 RepID=A0ABT8SJT0_9CAUL|nr:BA14K family protein [Caulobacteraceae bacterium XZ-24]